MAAVEPDTTIAGLALAPVWVLVLATGAAGKMGAVFACRADTIALATAIANSLDGDVTATEDGEADETVTEEAGEDEWAVTTGESKPADKLLLVERPGNPVPSIIPDQRRNTTTTKQNNTSENAERLPRQTMNGERLSKTKKNRKIAKKVRIKNPAIRQERKNTTDVKHSKTTSTWESARMKQARGPLTL